MAVDIKTSPRFEHGPPRALFQTHVQAPPVGAHNSYNYAAAPDGKRFLLVDREQEASTAPMIVVLNWNAGIRR